MLISKLNIRFRSFAVFALLLASGCGTWLGNPDDTTIQPSVTSTVSLKILGSSGTALTLADSGKIAVVNAAGVADGYLTLTTATAVLAEIKIKNTSTAAIGGEFKGPYFVNLITSTVSPSLDAIQVSAGGYQDIELKLAKLEKDKVAGIPETDPIIGHSIYFAGTYVTAAGTSRAFTFKFDLDEEFKLSSSRTTTKDVTIEAGVDTSLIMAFQLSKWFNFSNLAKNEKKLDFSSITGATIDINASESETAKNLREVIKENIKASARFGKDSDGDGKLAKSEDDDGTD